MEWRANKKKNTFAVVVVAVVTAVDVDHGGVGHTKILQVGSITTISGTVSELWKLLWA